MLFQISGRFAIAMLLTTLGIAGCSSSSNGGSGRKSISLWHHQTAGAGPGLIQQAVDRVMNHRTSLVVAHRLSTIQKCDRIMVFHHGELREVGTHNELLLERGLYWRLYQLQYSGEKLHPPAQEIPPVEIGLKSGTEV